MSNFISAEPFRRSTPSQLGFVPGTAPVTAEEIAPRFEVGGELLGLAPEVYRQIETAIAAKKRHFMFFGPPGTGKTELALYIARRLHPEHPPELITASADWSSQDLIGGYQPVGNGAIEFRPGTLLRAYDRPIIIDEFNRCDIDRVFGPLFSLLAGVDTKLPYVDFPGKADARDIMLLADPTKLESPQGARYSFTSGWRILATLNTSDKTALAQMSFALMRRFAWIYVAPPADRANFIHMFLSKEHLSHKAMTSELVLSRVWDAINAVRELGAAPFIDVIRYCAASLKDFDATDPANEVTSTHYVDALSIYVLPLLDGIREVDALSLGTQLRSILQLDSESAAAIVLGQRLDGIAS